MTEKKLHNRLINETSPYLLQHAGNPVDWYPWGKEALEKAVKEDKLIIVSIGYSACHWCHVMEHESFEDNEVAAFMNANYVNIKIDREERPDLDNVYMDALHLMGMQGGWPLNCICLPNGRPVYGGTYFPKENWLSVLHQLVEIFKNEKDKMEEYAENLTSGMDQQALLHTSENESFLSEDELDKLVTNWSANFDYKNGGEEGSPKFPMPSTLLFLLRYYFFTKNDKVKDHVELTLDKLAAGGIYDHLGGGFSRYSTDKSWKVPHFEKMLYDNAQLISVYAEAFRLFKKTRYKNVVYETFAFIESELSNGDGAFYAAIDADSENVEGKFYIWSYQEIAELLGDDTELFCTYYGIKQEGNWEDGINVLHNKYRLKDISDRFNKGYKEVEEVLTSCRSILFEKRKKRIRPETDIKVLCSWNALCISAYCDAYRTFEDQEFLKKAKGIYAQVKDLGLFKPERVNRLKKIDGSFVPGFLDDYALLAKALIDLYQADHDENYLDAARQLTELCVKNFFDESAMFFQYTSRNGEKLFAPKYEISDNVIPSSNSILANVLHQLGICFDNTYWLQLSMNMLAKITPAMVSNGRYFSNWAILGCMKIYNWPEIVVIGSDMNKITSQLCKRFGYFFLAGSSHESMLPIMRNRFIKDKTPVYICKNGSCKLPVYELSEVLKEVESDT